MAGKSDAWLPLYVADYLRDTMRLTTTQHGAYLLLLMAMWVDGGSLPDDAGELAAITKMSPSDWRKAAPVLMRYFRSEGGFITQKRMTAEVAKAQTISEKRREAGQLGGRPKKQTESKPKPNGFENAPFEEANGKQTETHARVALPSPRTPVSEPSGSDPVISEANASSSSGDDVRAAFDEFNALAKRLGLPEAKTLDATRRKAIGARLKPDGLAGWREALAAIERSRHCRGEGPKGWRADLDFVSTAAKFRKLREGSYDDERQAVAPSTPAPAWTGPVDVRAAVVAILGEDTTRSYLDPCGWRDVPDRAIVSSNGYRLDRLRRECGDALRTLGVRVLHEPSSTPEPERQRA